jgi:hypothetical protein
LLPGATNTDFFSKAGAEGTRAHQQAQHTDPAKVAKDGYDALMKGREKVVSGFMNKAQVAMSHVLPDDLITGTMRKQMERPVEPKPEREPENLDQSLLVTAIAVGFVAATTLLWAFGAMDRTWSKDAESIRRKTKSAGKSLFDSLSLN